jgi:amidase
MSELIYDSAVSLAMRIASRDLTCTQVMKAFLARIAEVNPKVNAICTLLADDALKQAKAKDVALAKGVEPGPLYGLPIAIKDLASTKGIRTTSGSPLFADHVPNYDDLFVERIKKAGAIVIGKTNTPEFGAGSHTFNRVFGTTLNPYDLNRSAGGSSGGAGAALASGMLPIADGSDFGGSLRNPASFNNVVGFRPTPGRVPRVPNNNLHEALAVMGPMGRSVEDAQLLFSVMAGPDLRDPLSLEASGSDFLGSLDRSLKDVRIAYTSDLGFLAVERETRDIIATAPKTFESLGAQVSENHPDLHDAEDIFLKLRASLFASRYGATFESMKPELKDTIIWNYEVGLEMDLADLAHYKEAHSALYQKGLAFFDTHDYLILPATQLTPFPADIDWPREVDGSKFTNYLQWMQSCCAITLLGAPAISVPCGFTQGGLPVGLQIVGRPRDDMGVLQVAYAFEQATKIGERRPEI